MDEARYVYGVVPGGTEVQFGPVGIDGANVRTIPCRGLCAVVHDCPARPYDSRDRERVSGWVLAHQRVLEEAGRRLGTVIPLSFDTIMKGGEGDDADAVVRGWLDVNHDRLQELLKKIEGRDEYAVKVSYDAEAVLTKVSEQSEEVRRIKAEIAGKPPGIAYLFRPKLDSTLRAGAEQWAAARFQECYGRIRPHCDDIVVEKTGGQENGLVQLLALSCLVGRGRVPNLGAELEGVRSIPGLSVHFSGPWPPYSFVGKPIAVEGRGA